LTNAKIFLTYFFFLSFCYLNYLPLFSCVLMSFAYLKFLSFFILFSNIFVHYAHFFMTSDPIDVPRNVLHVGRVHDIVYENETGPGEWHAQLSCGTFNSRGNPPVQVIFKVKTINLSCQWSQCSEQTLNEIIEYNWINWIYLLKKALNIQFLQKWKYCMWKC
jgi:hypothetical protein